jgi:hypothetical protein
LDGSFADEGAGGPALLASHPRVLIMPTAIGIKKNGVSISLWRNAVPSLPVKKASPEVNTSR